MIISEKASLEYDPYCNITLSFDKLILMEGGSYIKVFDLQCPEGNPLVRQRDPHLHTSSYQRERIYHNLGIR